MYEIRINKKIVLNVENTKAEVFYNVKAFVGDPWHTPVDGKIRYLSADTGNYRMCSRSPNQPKLDLSVTE